MQDGNNGDKTKEQLVIELEEVSGVLKLKREHYTNRAANPDPDATSFIARYIDRGARPGYLRLSIEPWLIAKSAGEGGKG